MKHLSSITKPVTFRIHIEQFEALERIRSKHDISASVIIRVLIQMFLQDEISGADSLIAEELYRTSKALAGTQLKNNAGIIALKQMRETQQRRTA